MCRCWRRSCGNGLGNDPENNVISEQMKKTNEFEMRTVSAPLDAFTEREILR